MTNRPKERTQGNERTKANQRFKVMPQEPTIQRQKKWIKKLQVNNINIHKQHYIIHCEKKIHPSDNPKSTYTLLIYIGVYSYLIFHSIIKISKNENCKFKN